uniref:Putative GMP synthase n=1 Tax=uncultured Actinomycetes bacterium TaxID=152507 RepID=A0A2R4S9Q3_9ACTN|nr:putative GMP synthase [uncultured Actinomycetes bacterium]
MSKTPVVLVVQNELDAPIGYLEEWLFERGVAIEVIYPFKGDVVPTEPGDFAGVIVLGGSRGVHDEDQWLWLKQEKELLRNVIKSQTPTLGVCLGGQLLADANGGKVGRTNKPEIGVGFVEFLPEAKDDCILSSVVDSPVAIPVPQYHQDAILELPQNAKLLVTSDDCTVQAFVLGKSAWGLQFHPETDWNIMSDWLVSEDEVRKTLGITDDSVKNQFDELGEGMKNTWRALGLAFAETVTDFAGKKSK